MNFSFNLCLKGSVSNIATVHINTPRNRRARDRLVVLKRCSLLGNSGGRMGIWLNWAEHMSPVFMLESVSTNMTEPGQHPGQRVCSLLLSKDSQVFGACIAITAFGVRIMERRNGRNTELNVNYTS